MKKIIVGFLLAFSSYCMAQDRWGDAHNKIHFVGNIGTGLIAGALIEDKPTAFAVALIPAVIREEYKRSRGFDHYAQPRIVVSLVGAGIGVYSSHWIIEENFIGYQWKY